MGKCQFLPGHVSSAMINFTIDDALLLVNGVFKFSKIRNLIKTDKVVKKWLLGQIVNKHSYCLIGKYYNCVKKWDR